MISLSLLNAFDLLLVRSPMISDEPLQFSSLVCFTEAFHTVDLFLKILLSSWMLYSCGFPPPLSSCCSSFCLLDFSTTPSWKCVSQSSLAFFSFLSCILSLAATPMKNYFQIHMSGTILFSESRPDYLISLLEGLSNFEVISTFLPVGTIY